MNKLLKWGSSAKWPLVITARCGPNLWFISANFQLHILLYVILYFFYRSPKLSVIITVSLMVASLLLFLVFSLTSLPGLPRAHFQIDTDSPIPLDSIRLYYTSPQSHILAYFAGVLIAIQLLQKQKQPTFSKRAPFLAVLCLLIFLLGTMYPFDAPLEWPEKEQSQSVLFMAIFLFIFSVIILSESIFFYLLILTEPSSLFKKLLRSRLLAPIGRLSLAIYLLNPLVNWTNLHRVRQTVPLTLEHLRNMFFIDYFRTVIWAILLYLFVQAPIQNLRYLLVQNLANKRNAQAANQRALELEKKTAGEMDFQMAVNRVAC